MLRSKQINAALSKLQKEIEGYAVDYGLDFYTQIFEMCDYDTINILAAQGGFPSRYPHWKFGMDYDQLSKGYRYGLQKIYEMVINTDPCYAYLLEVNNWVDQKLVMAHVYGHNDFFKNNRWFSNTNRKMMDAMANHGSKIRRYIDKYGQERVENFIDRVLSLENLIDLEFLFISQEQLRTNRNNDKEREDEKQFDGRSDALKSFMRTQERKDLIEENRKKIETPEVKLQKIPEKPMRDVLLFLIENAPLEDWETDVIGILREEAYYFLPQRMTKIMNEGWASYWHSKILTQRALNSSEIIDFAEKHARVMVMGRNQINPYRLGVELFEDIEFRWNTGRFGKEYHECDNMYAKENWDTKAMLGRAKIFEVRKTHNDITFIDEFLTPEFCERQQLFTYKYNPRNHRYEIESRDFQAIKQKLLNQLANFGSPLIEVVDANYKNRSELLLVHIHQNVDLDVNYATETLKNLYAIWKRPVNLKTTYEEKSVFFTFDGKEFKVQS